MLCGIVFVMTALRFYPKPPLSSRYTSSVAVYDARGQLLRLTLAKDDRYRLWLPLGSISPDIIEAFLLQEDRWFYRHLGVNPLSLVRGGWRTYVTREPRQGGSTITMQLARLIDRNPSRSLQGKVKQVVRALALEAMYSKRDILEAYLNLVPYGANIEGVGAASLIHFGKSTQSLSLPETLTLAVIPQAPAKRTLGRAVNRDQAHADGASVTGARRRLFDRWLARYPQAASQAGLMRLALNLRASSHLPFLAPHTVNHLVARDGGVSPEIHSTLDLRLQRTLERQIHRYVERQRRIGIENATAMLIDYRSMEVKAVVGSAAFHNAAINGQVNGTLAKRSPGSTLKPFIYALAMDQGLIHPLSVLKDAPAAFGPFSPENFDGTFIGPITARDALIRSRNIPAVGLAAKLSQPSLYDFLKRVGVSRMQSEKHYGLALALGGGDVTMEELVTMYGVLANRGVLRPLRYHASTALKTFPHPPPSPEGRGGLLPSPTGRRVGDEGKEAAENRESTRFDEGIRLISEEASFMTLDILRGNPRPEASIAGTRASIPVAWKTGTSWGFRDAWSAGVFGPYVLAVWIGRFDGEGNPAYVGVQAAAPLFFQIIDAIAAEDRGLIEPVFRNPLNLTRVEVCAASGDLPNVHCPMKATTWFVPGKSPIRVSDVHRAVMIDTRSGRVACPPYDPARVQQIVYEYWPSDLMRLFTQAGVPRRAPPTGDCGSTSIGGTPPAISAPVRGAAYVMRTSQPERNVVPLAATAEGGVNTLYWFANDSFVTAGKPGTALPWKPAQPGRYLLRVVDEQGRADSREVVVTAAP